MVNKFLVESQQFTEENVENKGGKAALTVESHKKTPGNVRRLAAAASSLTLQSGDHHPHFRRKLKLREVD